VNKNHLKNERVVQQMKYLGFTVFFLVLLVRCSEKQPVFPWIEDPTVGIAANDRLIGYEFFAKW